MIRVLSDVLTAADSRRVTNHARSPRHVSSTLDCVDHCLLLQRLEKNFVLTGVILQWLKSFLADRTREVFYNGGSSSTQQVQYGVPEGSVLGPLLFTLYTADINVVVAGHSLQLQQYADDCQVYISAPADDASTTITRLSRCFTNVAHWLSTSQLRLNPAKTVIIWLGSRQQVDKVSEYKVDIISSVITTVNTDRDLGGIVLDSHLTMSAQVVSVCRSPYCLPPSATSSSPITVGSCSQNSGPQVYFFTPGLLQLSCIWRHRQFTPTITSCTERRSTPSHRHSKVQTYHYSFATAPLVASSSANRIQARHPGV